MNIYFAGTPGVKKRAIALTEFQISRLHSYHLLLEDISLKENRACFFEFNYYTKMKRKTDPKKKVVKLFLDSGAFSAWSQNSEINIDEYIKFIKEHESLIDVYANLDAIGDPAQTFKNQKYMEKQGLRPMPVFHYGEDESWLLKYLDRGYDYLALGGMVPISTPKLIQWLDRLFDKYLTDSAGMPSIKIHGFGLTSLTLITRYPWYSVDSTSWVLTGRMGSVIIPKKKNGVWDYSQDPFKVAVSARSPDIKNAGKHITTLSKLEKKLLLEYIEEKGYALGKSHFKMIDQTHELAENERWVGKAPKDKTVKREIEIYDEVGLANQYQLRDELNIIYFLDLEKSLPEWPWRFETHGQTGLFS